MNLVANNIERAADAVRTANHSTMCGVLDAPQSCVAVGNLVELVQRLPQVLEFLARSLRRADPAQHRHTQGGDVFWVLQVAEAEIADARAQVDLLTGHLSAAHHHLGLIGRVYLED